MPRSRDSKVFAHNNKKPSTISADGTFSYWGLIEFKRAYQFFEFRDLLLSYQRPGVTVADGLTLAEQRQELYNSQDRSGLYSAARIREVYGDNRKGYSRINSLMRWFISKGLIERNKAAKVYKLNRLPDELQDIYGLYRAYKQQINSADKPERFFADLCNSHRIMARIKKQAYKIALSIENKADKVKFLRTVNQIRQGGNPQDSGKGARLGVSLSGLGINFSLATISREVDRSKATAYRYIESMNKSGIIERKRRYSKPLGSCTDLMKFRGPGLYGKLTSKVNGKRTVLLFERLQNDYTFFY